MRVLEVENTGYSKTYSFFISKNYEFCKTKALKYNIPGDQQMYLCSSLFA
jgi:hypothetical protein